VFSPNTSNICAGDSGGPLLLQDNGVWSIAAITSASSAGTCNTPATNFYVSVRNDAIISFIREHVRDAPER
jgi:trypsin